MRALVLIVLLVGCSATSGGATPQPTGAAATPSATGGTSAAATVSSATPSATAPVSALTTLADGTRVIRVPDCHPKDMGNYQIECQVVGITGDTNVAAVTIRRFTSGGYAFESQAIDLSTGAMFTLRPKAATSVDVAEIRDEVAILTDTAEAGVGREHVRVLRVPWRNATRAEVLDEFDLEGLGGGDTWNPWPSARTNGKDVAWLRPVEQGRLGIVLLRGDGSREVIYRTTGPVWFDLDDAGRIAIAARAAAGPDPAQQLVLYEGSLRVLGSRVGAEAGYVMAFGDRIGWTHGSGMVAPARDVELVSTQGATIRTIAPPAGCMLTGRTTKQILFNCGTTTQLFDAASFATRTLASGAVIASKRIIFFRESADVGADPETWRATLP
jgi:hypothetical protein